MRRINQISRLNSGGITASALDVMSIKEVSVDCEPEVVCDFNYSDKQKLEIGHYNIVFVHRSRRCLASIEEN